MNISAGILHHVGGHSVIILIRISISMKVKTKLSQHQLLTYVEGLIARMTISASMVVLMLQNACTTTRSVMIPIWLRYGMSKIRSEKKSQQMRDVKMSPACMIVNALSTTIASTELVLVPEISVTELPHIKTLMIKQESGVFLSLRTDALEPSVMLTSNAPLITLRNLFARTPLAHSSLAMPPISTPSIKIPQRPFWTLPQQTIDVLAPPAAPMTNAFRTNAIAPLA